MRHGKVILQEINHKLKMNNMSKIVLTDSCYWLGLVDPKDQHHETSIAIGELINNFKIIVPWPCLFESVSTRLVRNKERTIFFENVIRKPEIELFDDDKYRYNALTQVFELNRVRGNSYSLVDSVLREILKDKNVRIDYLVTFNERDFQDLCDERQIVIVNN